jgi:DNA-binding GntR family transcriptional regulator
VREALRMLEAEGLVVSERNRGAMVRQISPTEVADLYELRIRLEAYAVEVATGRITEPELGVLADAADAFGDVRRAVDVDSLDGVRALHEANRAFHDAILAAARHPRLAAMLTRTVDSSTPCAAAMPSERPRSWPSTSHRDATPCSTR